MASATKILEEKRRMRRGRMGRKRKNILGQKSTLSYAELFASLGEPSDAAPPAKTPTV